MVGKTTVTAATIALDRFGLGARPDEAPPADPKRSVLDQIERLGAKPAAFDTTRSSPEIATQYAAELQKLLGSDKADNLEARKALREEIQALYRAEVEARALAALDTNTPFMERLVYFWSNHFAVSANKPRVTALAGAFEREAIRPFVLGRFNDMLLAVEHHPAMLFFLDRVGSIGPNSQAAQRAEAGDTRRKLGINENLAREIMELHTLGARSGYNQSDVTEFALALTGWSTGRIGEAVPNHAPGVFVFRPALHEPGSRRILGKTYSQPGEGQAESVLQDLATHPATANHIGTKLARHFVADTPLQPVVERLSTTFSDTGGDLPSVYRALIDLPEAWTSQPAKFKTPWDWTISALRGIGRRDLDGINVAPLLNQLGQPVWRPGSPAGYDDTAASWAAPDALVRRVEVAERIAATSPSDVDPRELARKLFPDSLSEPTAGEIDRADSARTGLALLLVSPEFQRR
ncbi:DUF1800 domain-containing protein [Mesorhizobium sp. BAC0120]|uniref:DUF1800 domain-containing protein n=1 Tax=Mesorhizobium sp. BAC0120 TaxID=3090670 RepID=UPI00298D5D40|nr:DUF1800 domain-containing protein [Mesorhizobium sp. BAC0120]MDW6026321.1 DUF1800 domain-containing protein [Mesorhizobium sp. BAC0120]